MKTTDKRTLCVRLASCLLLILSCFYTYDFYKCLSGFIANGFREPLTMLPMILAFLLPFICFLFFFYDVYVRAIHPVVKAVYSVAVSLYAAADLALIVLRMELYVSNNALGVYDALPGIFLRFPYDATVVLAALLVWQMFSLAVADRRGGKVNAVLNSLKQRGTVRIGACEYAALSLVAIFVFVFTGAALFGAVSAYKNAFYDFRYVFLIVWVMLIPMANLALLILHPERMELKRSVKLALFGSGVAANLVFGLLFLILEVTYPDFLVHIGKPLFMIAFSVSLPIEPTIILGIMLAGTAVFATRLVLTAKKG